MKELAAVALALLFGGISSVATAAGAQAIPPKELKPDITVNMAEKTLPTKVELIVGQTVLFDNTGATATVKNLDGNKKPLLKSVHAGCGLSKAFSASRAGNGEVVFTKNGVTRKVKVVIHPLTLGFNLSKSAPPKTVTILKGQRVSFISKDIVEVSVRTTDGGAGTAVTEDDFTRHVHLARGWQSLKAFESQRAGKGEFTITWFDGSGKKVRSQTVPVTVR